MKQNGLRPKTFLMEIIITYSIIINIIICSSDGKESACNVGYLGLILGLGTYPGEGNSNPLQYSCLENSMDRGAWQATVHGHVKSWTQLSNFHTHTHTHTHVINNTNV